MEAIAVPRLDHGGDSTIELIGPVVLLGAGEVIALHHLDLLGGRDDHLLMHVADRFIGHDEHRHAVGFRQVEGLYGQIETLLRAVRAQGDDAVIPVGAPASLHHVLLGGQSGQTG